MRNGAITRTIESRRASGEATPVLPIIAGGRPTLSELERPPAGLNKWARDAWREVVPQLIAGKLVDRVDRQALEAYALHMGRARALREEIEWIHEAPDYDPETGELRNPKTMGRRIRERTLEEQFRAVTARGFTSNPLLSQEREALREARMMGELLGLSPVGRTRIAATKKERTGLAGLVSGLPMPMLAVVGDDDA